MKQWNLKDRGIRDERVLAAMASVPRENFVPEHLRNQADGDYPLPIGYGQTISQPYIVAVMTELLGLGQKDDVLEIGTGSGYQTAILATLAKHVYTVELVPELLHRAQDALETVRLSNVTFRLGDGYKGWAEKAPFDAIILTASPPEMPQALVDQLKVGGKLVAPIGLAGDVQQLTLVERTRDGRRQRRIMAVSFVPMVHPD